MKVIPVIDYMNGQVVLAEKGNRSNYLPVNSNLCKHSEVHSVIEKILSLANFNTIYIADLDSISQQTLNIDLWQSVFTRYSSIEFWCDIGTQISSWKLFASNSLNIRPVIGSESFSNMCELTEVLKLTEDFNPLLSLDFNSKSLLGPNNMLDSFSNWPEDIIILTLNRVGSFDGPDFELLETLKNQLSNCKIYTGGGIRNKQDLQRLKLLGLSGVLIAKSLHAGTINSEDLKHFSD